MNEQKGLRAALLGLARSTPGDPLCFCGMAIGYPMIHSHTEACMRAREALASLDEPAGTRIVASAIRLDSVTYTGLRHHQIIGYLADAGFPTPIGGEQGFIDDQGRFLSRKEAADLALKSGQVAKLLFPGMGLDSADIFPCRAAPSEPAAQSEAKTADQVIAELNARLEDDDISRQ